MKEHKKKHIAFVYEGEKTEKALIQKMIQVYFSDISNPTIITLSASGNLYMLWNKLREYSFQAEVIDVMKEISQSAKETLEGLTARDFSEVYLFFDYDAHNDNLPKEYRDYDVVKEMLAFYDNETEFGKLYISYPMIESLRELSKETEDYGTFYAPLNNEWDYKQYVANQWEFQNFSHMDKDKWEVACRASVKRANLIVNYKEQIPTYKQFLDELNQKSIYNAQIACFVLENKMVGVLNSVPLFLLEYFDITFWNKVCQNT